MKDSEAKNDNKKTEDSGSWEGLSNVEFDSNKKKESDAMSKLKESMRIREEARKEIDGIMSETRAELDARSEDMKKSSAAHSESIRRMYEVSRNVLDDGFQKLMDSHPVDPEASANREAPKLDDEDLARAASWDEVSYLTDGAVTSEDFGGRTSASEKVKDEKAESMESLYPEVYDVSNFEMDNVAKGKFEKIKNGFEMNSRRIKILTKYFEGKEAFDGGEIAEMLSGTLDALGVDNKTIDSVGLHKEGYSLRDAAVDIDDGTGERLRFEYSGNKRYGQNFVRNAIMEAFICSENRDARDLKNTDPDMLEHRVKLSLDESDNKDRRYVLAEAKYVGDNIFFAFLPRIAEMKSSSKKDEIAKLQRVAMKYYKDNKAGADKYYEDNNIAAPKITGLVSKKMVFEK